MLTAQNVYDSFKRLKRDLGDVDEETGLFLEWLRFAVRYLYGQIKAVDASRFITTQSYSVVLPPQSEDLPSDFMDLKQTECGLYPYDTRRRLVVGFNDGGDTDVTFTDASATSAYNSNIHVEGSSSRGYTGDAADTMKLTFGTAIDFDDFDDSGAVSSNTDFISVYVYIGNTVPTSATVGMYSTSAKTNGWTTQNTSLAAGWNRIKVAKSAFTEVGTGDFTNIGYIELIHAGGDATTNVYWDKLELVESEVNGNGESKHKIGVTGYGYKAIGYYLKRDEVVFTDHDERPFNRDYVMRYIPQPPSINDLDDYITTDKLATGQAIIEERHLEDLVKALDIRYETWDVAPASESLADFRYVRALDVILSEVSRTPQVAKFNNPNTGF